MPLIHGNSPAARKTNIAEVLRSYKATGRIGTSRPKDTRQAIRQAVAIGYAQSRKP